MNNFTEDLNIIQNLADRPTQNAKELKAEFDKAGNLIKDYLNNTVATTVSQMEKDIEDKVSSKEFEELSNQINEDIEDKISDINNATASLKKVAVQYGDFTITTTPTYSVDHGHGGMRTEVQTITKDGYYPLGIVGHTSESINHYNNSSTGPCIMSAYLNNRTNGSCRLNVKLLVANNTNWTYSSNYSVQILWIKIKS